MTEDSVYEARIRKAGGGRKPYDESHPDIDEKFLAVMADYRAGDPMNAEIQWTDLSPREIAKHLAQDCGIEVSDTLTRQLLVKYKYRRRKIQKK